MMGRLQKMIGAARCMLLCGALIGGQACAGQTWQDALPQAQPLGSGEMTWFGLRIYQATLWAAQQPFDYSRPFALQLTYQRSIDRARLVRVTMDEIRRLSTVPLADETASRWESMLDRVMIGVDKGDQLIGVYLPGRGMRLYDARTLLGEIDEPALAKAFFDIWLNPATRDQSLRRRLLGQ